MADRRGPSLWPLGFLVVLLIGLPIAAWLRDAYEEPDYPIGVEEEPPTAYRIVYLVEAISKGASAPSTEIVTVRRPFQSRVETRVGSPPGGEVISVTTSDFGRRQYDSGGQSLVIVVEPGPPDGDTRVESILFWGEARGLVTYLEKERDIAGRRCGVYRIPVLSPSGEHEGDNRELCVDSRGLILGDDLVLKRTGTVRRRTAVSVAIDPAIDEQAFAIDGVPLSLDDGGGAITALTPDSRTNDATVYELRSAPAGFKHRGRFALSPASSKGQFGDVEALRIVGVVDVWEKGADYIAIFNGGADNAADPFRDEPGAESVDLGPFTGEAVVSLSGSEVRAELEGGRFVRVFGTLNMERLVNLARNLEPVTGGAITPLEPPTS